jgi:hypothetical protein
MSPHFPCPSSEQVLRRNVRVSWLVAVNGPEEGFAYKFAELEIDWQAPGRHRQKNEDILTLCKFQRKVLCRLQPAHL